MGVPKAIIVIIVLIMSMFAIAGVILFKNRERFLKQTIDPVPSNKQQE
jgi:hypothetical protein